MDEPSSGVDPASRRKLWRIIRSVQRNGQAIILTSHSMEECDELCGRLGIMVNGQFQCFGPTRYLKQKFGQGFTILGTDLLQKIYRKYLFLYFFTNISVKLNTQDKTPEEYLELIQSFKNYINSQFDGCLVKDEHKVSLLKTILELKTFQ